MSCRSRPTGVAPCPQSAFMKIAADSPEAGSTAITLEQFGRHAMHAMHPMARHSPHSKPHEQATRASHTTLSTPHTLRSATSPRAVRQARRACFSPSQLSHHALAVESQPPTLSYHASVTTPQLPRLSHHAFATTLRALNNVEVPAGAGNFLGLLFNAFDKNGDGVLNYVEFCAGLSIILEGAPPPG